MWDSWRGPRWHVAVLSLILRARAPTPDLVLCAISWPASGQANQSDQGAGASCVCLRQCSARLRLPTDEDLRPRQIVALSLTRAASSTVIMSELAPGDVMQAPGIIISAPLSAADKVAHRRRRARGGGECFWPACEMFPRDDRAAEDNLDGRDLVAVVIVGRVSHVAARCRCFGALV